MKLLQGDCRELMARMPENSVDSIICDPPYGLSKDPDIAEVLAHWLAGDPYVHLAKGGFMGKAWDTFVPGPEYWRECFRVLKPGGYLLSFAGSRTQDLMSIAIRLGGFEIRDTLQWIYGTGFPKSLNVEMAVDEQLCGQSGRHYHTTFPAGAAAKPGDHLCASTVEGDAQDGWGTALKPAYEPIIMARRPLVGTVAANVLAHGTGGLNIDATRIEYQSEADKASATPQGECTAASAGAVPNVEGAERVAFERPEQKGRWPANVVLDEEAGALLDAQAPQAGAASPVSGDEPSVASEGVVTGKRARVPGVFHADTGGASRFFYCAKASRSERDAGCDALPVKTGGELTDRQEGTAGLANPRAGAGRTSGGRNTHPTVKPVALMRWLVRLVTPPGGIVVDPFLGSGTTGVACQLEGFEFIGMELDPEYLCIAEARLGVVSPLPAPAPPVVPDPGLSSFDAFLLGLSNG